MWLRVVAAAAFAAFLFALFRFAMGLRASRLAREGERRAEEARGRRVVAEVPDADGLVRLVLEDAHGFYVGGAAVAKTRVRGARLLLNGAIVQSAARPGVPLPEPSLADVGEDGRERWDVDVYVEGGPAVRIACGTLREGVSREAAATVFTAVRAAVERE